jgi:hypothetical protein
MFSPAREERSGEQNHYKALRSDRKSKGIGVHRLNACSPKVEHFGLEKLLGFGFRAIARSHWKRWTDSRLTIGFLYTSKRDFSP